MNWSKKFQQVRIGRGLTTTQVAVQLGISERAVQYYEQGVRVPSRQKVLQALAQNGYPTPPKGAKQKPYRTAFKGKEGSFGALFRTERLKRNLTEAQMGQKIGVHHSTISCWESGRIYPRGRTILVLSKLGLPVPGATAVAPTPVPQNLPAFIPVTFQVNLKTFEAMDMARTEGEKIGDFTSRIMTSTMQMWAGK